MVPVVSPLFSFVRHLVSSILSSLKATIVDLLAAVRQRSLARLVALLREGSPLEDLVNNLLVAVFWVLVLAPLILIPLYYLALSVVPK